MAANKSYRDRLSPSLNSQRLPQSDSSSTSGPEILLFPGAATASRPTSDLTNKVGVEEKTSTRVAVNAAFMWEIKSVNEELWELFDRVLACCARPTLILRRPRVFVGQLEQLLDLVGMQLTLEEAYGYFEEPERVEAHISSKAIELRDEHADLYCSLMTLVDRAQEWLFEDDTLSLAKQLPHQFQSFTEQFRAHDERECELTLSSMNQDLGVGD